MTLMRAPSHWLFLGDSGTGKDSAAAQFIGPKLVWMLDGFGQDLPYWKGAKDVSDLKYTQLGNVEYPYRDIIAHDDTLTRVEYFASDDPTRPVGITILEARMTNFRAEAQAWSTLICGSLSSISIEGRYYSQYVTSPGQANALKWYGAANSAVERFITIQKSWPINTVLTAHLRRESDNVSGGSRWIADLPGKDLPYNAYRYFSEVYHFYVRQVADGEYMHVVETRKTPEFPGKSQIDAPEILIIEKGSTDLYERLWSNYGK